MIQDRVSFIILNWNNKETIFECLDSVFAQSYPNYEVILVDNASHDGSQAMLQKKYGSRLRLVQNEKNLGFSGGVNKGLEASEAEFVALLNSDAFLNQNWLEEMVRGIQSDENIGMGACKIYLAQESGVLDNTGEIICFDGQGSARGRLEKDTGQFDQSSDVLCPSGCAGLYRRKMLDEAGWFDAKTFAYMEDVEMGFKGRLLGYTARYIPEAVAYHHLSRSSGVISFSKAYLVERNRLWMVIKCFPVSSILLSFWYTFLRYYFHAYGVVKKRGPAAAYTNKFGFWTLVWIVIRAHLSTVFHLGHLLRERCILQKKSKITLKEFRQILKTYGIGPDRAALRDLR